MDVHRLWQTKYCPQGVSRCCLQGERRNMKVNTCRLQMNVQMAKPTELQPCPEGKVSYTEMKAPKTGERLETFLELTWLRTLS